MTDENLKLDTSIEGSSKKKVTPTKKEKSPTTKKTYQHNKIRQDELVKWTVFVQAETKAAVGKAAQKSGTTVTDWVDSRLREVAQSELTKKPQLPAKPEDLVADIVQQFADKMNAAQEASMAAQNEVIKKQGEQIASLAQALENNQPKSIREILFGKSKKE